ncbi:hypothetical protein [Tychonema sp. LEGE 07203]|uniref:hypothetical protein n=1 Tax=Tychonema sp. LEGE 07203 TaxID=1828671 RepID=UPI001881A59C|nr:hypothetical protein [Tychonema sp. LEGE 07203]MBE9094699.1 hypothetical protein [Tychonema sp. LEGE 07203]
MVETKAQWLPIQDLTSLGKYTRLFVTNFTIKMLKNQQLEQALNVLFAAALLPNLVGTFSPVSTSVFKLYSQVRSNFCGTSPIARAKNTI